MNRVWPENTQVLVVEDDQATARLIQARLEMEGLKVFLAHNGVEGLELLHREDIDLVTTDLMMPAINGFRLVQEIRDLPPPRGHVPILLISSNRNDQDMVRCLAAGANDYITKPISAQVLIEHLWRMHQRALSAG